MRVVRERLQDILDAIAQIEIERNKGRDSFSKERLIQVWMVHHLMIIGEAVRSIDPAFRQQHPCVPWRQIAGMRNILVHDYFQINERIVWETVEQHLPPLKLKIQQLLDQLPSEQS